MLGALLMTGSCLYAAQAAADYGITERQLLLVDRATAAAALAPARRAEVA
jgi:hypothetical protein